MKKALIDAADTTYLVADSTKIARSAFTSLGTSSLIDYIITDAGIGDEHKEVFRQNEIELLIAE